MKGTGEFFSNELQGLGFGIHLLQFLLREIVVKGGAVGITRL